MIPSIILCAAWIVNVVHPPERNSSGVALYWGAFPDWGAFPALQQERRAELAEPRKARATFYIATVKDTLSQQNYELFSKALQQYKKTDDFHAMLSQMSSLFLEDEKKHVLLRGTSQCLYIPAVFVEVTFVFCSSQACLKVFYMWSAAQLGWFTTLYPQITQKNLINLKIMFQLTS